MRAWEAAGLAAGTLAAAAVLFWATNVLMGVVFPASPAQPLPVVMPASSSHAPPKGRPSPSRTHHRHVVVAPASLSPVSAVPIRTRQPSPAVAPPPARTTPRPPVSVTPTPPPTPTPSGTPTASVAPSTAITAPPPDTGSGLP